MLVEGRVRIPSQAHLDAAVRGTRKVMGRQQGGLALAQLKLGCRNKDFPTHSSRSNALRTEDVVHRTGAW
jgi:hypothetical protein